LKIQSLLIILFLAFSVVAVNKYENRIFASANWVGAIPLEIEISSNRRSKPTNNYNSISREQ
jgi:hypothetical protein